MSDQPDLLTAANLRKMRLQMQQTPRSMAKLLGVRLARYYQWERVGKFPVVISLAMKFLATQEPPAEAPLIQRRVRSSQERFQAGARLGRLVVLRIIKPGGGMNLRIAVQCDCGVVKTWQAPMLNRYRQCSRTCALADTPLPPDATPATHGEWEAGL